VVFADTSIPPNVATNSANPVHAEPAVTSRLNVNDVVSVEIGVPNLVVVLNKTEPFCPDPDPPPFVPVVPNGPVNFPTPPVADPPPPNDPAPPRVVPPPPFPPVL